MFLIIFIPIPKMKINLRTMTPPTIPDRDVPGSTAGQAGVLPHPLPLLTAKNNQEARRFSPEVLIDSL